LKQQADELEKRMTEIAEVLTNMAGLPKDLEHLRNTDEWKSFQGLFSDWYNAVMGATSRLLLIDPSPQQIIEETSRNAATQRERLAPMKERIQNLENVQKMPAGSWNKLEKAAREGFAKLAKEKWGNLLVLRHGKYRSGQHTEDEVSQDERLSDSTGAASDTVSSRTTLTNMLVRKNDDVSASAELRAGAVRKHGHTPTFVPGALTIYTSPTCCAYSVTGAEPETYVGEAHSLMRYEGLDGTCSAFSDLAKKI
jgi:hypothetical protein